MESDSLSLFVAILCLLLSAIFSSIATAYLNLSRSRIKAMIEDENKKAKVVLKLSDSDEFIVNAVNIGNIIVNVLAATFFSKLLDKFVFGENVSIFVSILISILTVLLFGEIIPKSIAAEIPEKTAIELAYITRIFAIILSPFAFLSRGVSNLFSSILKTKDDKADTEEELLTIVEEAEEEGEINEHESTLIKSAIEFSEQEAIDVLTPRIDIVGALEGSSKEEIAKLFSETGFSRLPIYSESIDHIVGIIYLKDFYNKVYNTKKPIKDIIRPAVYTTQNKKISELLRELQVKKLHIAVVLDEYGGTMGIVTLEDIIEELVGEIWDEHDEVTEEIVTSKENEYIVLGSTNIEEMFEELEIRASEEFEVQTVSGWVMDKLGQIPKVGDSFTDENLSVTVTEMDEKRVDKIKVTILPKTEEE